MKLIFYLIEKSKWKEFLLLLFPGSTCDRKKKVVSTPLVLIHLLRRSKNVALALACLAILSWVE